MEAVGDGRAVADTWPGTEGASGGEGAGVTAVAAFIPDRTSGIASATVSSICWVFNLAIGAPGDLGVEQKLLPILLERVTKCYCCDYC
jgi:hypothetical protein